MSFFTGAPFVYAEGWHLSVSDGYYVMLAPLPAGRHTIHIRTGPIDDPFCDVYYNITVKHDKCDDDHPHDRER